MPLRLEFREIPNLDLTFSRHWNFRAGYSHFHQLLMEESRKEKELGVTETKTLAALGDTDFSQENNLFAPPQRLADQRPFLETDALHFARRKLASPRWPSTSTSIRIPFSQATGSPVQRRTSRPREKRGCTVLPSPITTPATRSLISSRKDSCARTASRWMGSSSFPASKSRRRKAIFSASARLCRI